MTVAPASALSQAICVCGASAALPLAATTACAGAHTLLPLHTLYSYALTIALANFVHTPWCGWCRTQVQIYDLAGFKLSYVNSDMMALFKVLFRLLVPNSSASALTQQHWHDSSTAAAPRVCPAAVLFLRAGPFHASCLPRPGAVCPLLPVQMLVRFGLYYPERLRLALVINAPAWFSTPWKAMSVFLDENTSAKVVVVGKPEAALSTITHHLGGLDNVPVAWGGTCELSFEDYPATRRMLEFGRQLNAGQKPFPGLRVC